MTRALPPKDLQAASVPRPALSPRVAEDIFKGAPAWQVHVAMAAVYRLRPDLGIVPDPDLHALHMLVWWRQGHTDYFLRLCRLMKVYGIGVHEGAA